jgi:hypothetical protein
MIAFQGWKLFCPSALLLAKVAMLHPGPQTVSKLQCDKPKQKYGVPMHCNLSQSKKSFAKAVRQASFSKETE